MNSKTITKTIITTNQALTTNWDVPDDLINLLFEFTGNIWEPVDSVDHNKYLYKINIIKATDPWVQSIYHNDYYCDVCRHTMSKKKLVDTHINSEKHINKLKKYKNKSLQEVHARVKFKWRGDRIQEYEVVPINYDMNVLLDKKYEMTEK